MIDKSVSTGVNVNNFSYVSYAINSADGPTDQIVYVQPALIADFFGNAGDVIKRFRGVNVESQQDVACSLREIFNSILGIYQATRVIVEKNGHIEYARAMDKKMIFLDNLIGSKLNIIFKRVTNGRLETEVGQMQINNLFSPLNKYYYITATNDLTGQSVHGQFGKYQVSDSFTKVYLSCLLHPRKFGINATESELLRKDTESCLYFVDLLTNAVIFNKGNPFDVHLTRTIFSDVDVKGIPAYSEISEV